MNHVKFHNYYRKIAVIHGRRKSSRFESQAAQERRRSQGRGSLNTYGLSGSEWGGKCLEV